MGTFDPAAPSIARVYDYFLGGKDNFAVDRELADRLLTLVPEIAEFVTANRRFLAQAVTWAANQGIGQFIDLGCGMPTVPNTHQSVQAVNRDARVVYVDNDPVVLRHLHDLPADGNPRVSVVDGDVRDVAVILEDARLDLSAPACLVAGFLLHFFTADAARDLIARYTAVLAPGSCVVISVVQSGDSAAADEVVSMYSSSTAPLYIHGLTDVASFFGPLELVPPGIVDARQWRQDLKLDRPRGSYAAAGVARKQERS